MRGGAELAPDAERVIELKPGADSGPREWTPFEP
jgi:hypothetical protein